MPEIDDPKNALENVNLDVRPCSPDVRQPLVCIDGRYQTPRIGAPGGDLGEFVLLLAAVEKHTGEAVDETWVEDALNQLIDDFPPFHMHTDEAAMTELSYLFDTTEERDIETIIRTPEPQERERLTDLLTTPKYNGCGHLSCVMQSPSSYELLRGAVERAIVTFYKRLWEQPDDVDLEILRGEHEEVASVAVETPSEADETLCADVADEGDSVFIEHPEERRTTRRAFVDSLNDAGLLEGVIERDTLLELADTLEPVHRRETMETLAPTLPSATLEID